MSTAPENKTVVPPQAGSAQAATQAATQSTAQHAAENKTEQKTGLAKYRRYLYLFFASSAGLLISYFAYRRYQKRH